MNVLLGKIIRLINKNFNFFNAYRASASWLLLFSYSTEIVLVNRTSSDEAPTVSFT